ncbi:MAG: phosphoribosylformylglycinamidine synthase subunit PurS [Bacteroidota bacterium]|nr:phosphoribosylformylglycinamidine synthase subunit PurS [Bacteroidota bacterium]
MKFTAEIDVMPLGNLLDPQGKAVKQTLINLKYDNIANVRLGKHIVLTIDAVDKENAKKIAEEVSKKVLANQVMEHFDIKIKKA